MFRNALICCFVLASFPAIAQNNSKPEPSDERAPRTPAVSASQLQMQGCINGGREAYTFTQTGTGAAFLLRGDAQNFESFRGKLVSVTGIESPPTSRTALKDLPELTTSKVQVIAAECPLATTGKMGVPAAAPNTVPPTRTAPPQNPAPSAATPRYEPSGAPKQTPPSTGNNPNVTGATGAPSPGTGNPPSQPPPSIPPI
jgi:hypothetical protein